MNRRQLLSSAAVVAASLGTGILRARDGIAANPVLLWNEAFLQWVRAQTPPPCLTARNLAILHLALWRAARGMELRKVPGEAAAAAMGAAGGEICRAIFPSQQAEIASREESVRVAPAVRPELVAGALRTAREIMASRADDGASTTVHYVPKDAPGQWRRTPPSQRPPELPHWGKATPFLLTSADQFRPPPPPDIAGDVFAKELTELRDLGGKDSAQRTAGETESAKFWSDFSYTTSPPGHWNDIARELATARRLSPTETARLFALLNLALADAGIATWECKFHYNFWRPVTALNLNPAAKWQPLLATPPHPEYVSGHSAFSGAATAVLESFFGTDNLTFSAASDTVKNVRRQFRSLKACAEEISRSRVIGGIHFPAACREGLALGRKIGTWTVQAFK